jgi:hypothetical protein
MLGQQLLALESRHQWLQHCMDMFGQLFHKQLRGAGAGSHHSSLCCLVLYSLDYFA